MSVKAVTKGSLLMEVWRESGGEMEERESGKSGMTKQRLLSME